MSDFKVSQNVPPPDVQHLGGPGGSEPKYPWPMMKEGDSFVVPIGDDPPRKVYDRMRQAGYWWCRRNQPEMTVLVRKEGDFMRVWKIMKKDIRLGTKRPL